MTLDDLIEDLLAFRRTYPAAGGATVIGFYLDGPTYDRGEVQFEPRQLIEIGMPAPRAPSSGTVQ
jgi:hypothetical protein